MDYPIHCHNCRKYNAEHQQEPGKTPVLSVAMFPVVTIANINTDEHLNRIGPEHKYNEIKKYLFDEGEGGLHLGINPEPRK